MIGIVSILCLLVLLLQASIWAVAFLLVTAFYLIAGTIKLIKRCIK